MKNSRNAPLQFLLADDHAIIRRGLTQILVDAYPDVQITETDDAAGALKNLKQRSYDLLISDISMPGVNGLELLKRVKVLYAKLPILILSMHAEEQYAIRALRAGAAGYLAKDSAPEELIKAVQHVLVGKKYVSSSLAAIMAEYIGEPATVDLHELLSDRELEVLKLIAKGKSITQIGEILFLSPNTISTYRSRILEKMKVKTNAELIHYVIENGLI